MHSMGKIFYNTVRCANLVHALKKPTTSVWLVGFIMVSIINLLPFSGFSKAPACKNCSPALHLARVEDSSALQLETEVCGQGLPGA